MSISSFIDHIVEFLEEEFGGLKIDAQRNDQAAINEFQIEADVDRYMLLNIVDGCFTHNSLDDIKNVLSGAGRVILESNLNKTVQLNADLTVTV